VLVTVRAGEPEKGRVDVPGGFLEPGEHPVDALVREVREELGVEIDDIVGPLVMATHNYGEGGPYVLALGFAARLVEGEPQPADDVAEFRWVTAKELDDLDFAWRVCKHVKSNAIVYAKDGATLGIGAGQMSRVDASEIAVRKAAKEGLDLAGSVVASDAFFPFADGLVAAAEAGAIAAIQPGGSVRDDEVIEAANARDLAMVFTGQRHFRH